MTPRMNTQTAENVTQPIIRIRGAPCQLYQTQKQLIWNSTRLRFHWHNLAFTLQGLLTLFYSALFAVIDAKFDFYGIKPFASHYMFYEIFVICLVVIFITFASMTYLLLLEEEEGREAYPNIIGCQLINATALVAVLGVPMNLFFIFYLPHRMRIVGYITFCTVEARAPDASPKTDGRDTQIPPLEEEDAGKHHQKIDIDKITQRVGPSSATLTSASRRAQKLGKSPEEVSKLTAIQAFNTKSSSKVFEQEKVKETYKRMMLRFGKLCSFFRSEFDLYVVFLVKSFITSWIDSFIMVVTKKTKKPSKKATSGVDEKHQMCPNGHTLCSICKFQVKSCCPICRINMDSIKCLALEKVSGTIKSSRFFHGVINSKRNHSRLNGLNIEGGLHEFSSIKSKAGPWFQIAKLNGDLSEYGIDLQSIFKVKVGNGESTYFWTDKWVGNSPLCSVFPRLYRLESNKQCRVCDRTPTVISSSATDSVFSAVGSVGRSYLSPPGLQFYWAWNRSLRYFLLDTYPCNIAFIRFMGDDNDAKNFRYSLTIIANCRKLSWQGVPSSIRHSHQKILDSLTD
ncbi:hypothetical protein CTI12_AA506990 [Artemisia annua]|uniref:Seven-in-absentia protein TRAF-like domain-containing protein n=1 Tax=Artemisia annua TaxID=35608 RepID=A0A2U1L4Y1_ARTAN|nr:hypothetical protein CTI12_AA506990 [Artemisia annua]